MTIPDLSVLRGQHAVLANIDQVVTQDCYAVAGSSFWAANIEGPAIDRRIIDRLKERGFISPVRGQDRAWHRWERTPKGETFLREHIRAHMGEEVLQRFIDATTNKTEENAS